MTNKRFMIKDCPYECFLEKRIFDCEYEKEYDSSLKSQQDLCDLLNQLTEENKQLKEEIKMLKTTIGRNEGYIDRVTHKGEWKTYGDLNE